MSDEAFPNSERLFCEAFSQPDPAPELLKLIAEHPTYYAVADMLVCYSYAAEETPSRAEALASTLVTIHNAPNAPKIPNTSLLAIYRSELADLHSRGLDLDDDNKVFGPMNTYLIHSLLSGLSFKYNMSSCSDQYGAILEGLNAQTNSAASEVLVAGACIQLATSGSNIIPTATSYVKSANEVATKLKTQKSAGVVKNPNVLKVLELAISHAETGFKKESDVDGIWQLLFPVKT